MAMSVSPVVGGSVSRSMGRQLRAAGPVLSLSAPSRLRFLKAGKRVAGQRLSSPPTAVWLLCCCFSCRGHGCGPCGLAKGQDLFTETKAGLVEELCLSWRRGLSPAAPLPFQGRPPCRPGLCLLRDALGRQVVPSGSPLPLPGTCAPPSASLSTVVPGLTPGSCPSRSPSGVPCVCPLAHVQGREELCELVMCLLGTVTRGCPCSEH